MRTKAEIMQEANEIFGLQRESMPNRMYLEMLVDIRDALCAVQESVSTAAKRQQEESSKDRKH